MSKCLSESCKKEIKQTPGKREKKFCNSTCRSNQFAKEKRRRTQDDSDRSTPLPKDFVEIKKIGAVSTKGGKKVIIKDVTKPTNPAPKSKFVEKTPRNAYLESRLKSKQGLK